MLFSFLVFTDDEKRLVLQFVRKIDSAQLETMQPACHLVGSHGIEHFTELLYLLLAVGGPATKAVEFLVFVVVYLLCGCPQEILLADLMLTTAFNTYLHILKPILSRSTQKLG